MKNIKKLTLHKKYILITLALLLVILVIYSKKDNSDKLPIDIEGKTVLVEVADSPKKQALGLMYRKKLDKDEGMLFIFADERAHSFWMKNTLITLDMIWLNSKKEVVHIEHSAPPCKESPCLTYSSQFPAMYVLELNGGWAIENDLGLGDTLAF